MAVAPIGAGGVINKVQGSQCIPGGVEEIDIAHAHISSELLQTLYSQMKQIDCNGSFKQIESAPKSHHSGNYKSHDEIEAFTLVPSDAHKKLLRDFLADDTETLLCLLDVEIRDFRIDVDMWQPTLDLLLDNLFYSSEVNDTDCSNIIARLLVEFRLDTKLVLTLQDFLVETHEPTVWKLIGDFLLPPYMAKICLAALYTKVDLKQMAWVDAKYNEARHDVDLGPKTEEVLREFEEIFSSIEVESADELQRMHEIEMSKLKKDQQNSEQLMDNVSSKVGQLLSQLQSYARDMNSRRQEQESFGRQLDSDYQLDAGRGTGIPERLRKRLCMDEEQMEATTSTSTFDDEIQVISPSDNINPRPGNSTPSTASKIMTHPGRKLRVDDNCYVQLQALDYWWKAVVNELNDSDNKYTVTISHEGEDRICRVHGSKMAFYEAPSYTLKVGTRIVAHFKYDDDIEGFYGGMVAEQPSVRTKQRYLIFFDDAFTQYCLPQEVLCLVQSVDRDAMINEFDIHCRDFIKQYLEFFPEKAMVRLKEGGTVQCEYNSVFLACEVLKTDCSLALLRFPKGCVASAKREWIYRGSTRLGPLFYQRLNAQKGQARGRIHRTGITAQQDQLVEYPRIDLDNRSSAASVKKNSKSKEDQVEIPSPVIKPDEERIDLAYEHRYHTLPVSDLIPQVPHNKCTRDCLGPYDAKHNSLFPDKNPLMIPLLSGWKRLTKKIFGVRGNKPKLEVEYVMPCGKRLCGIHQIQRTLLELDSYLTVDFFTYEYAVEPTRYAITPNAKVVSVDITRGREPVKIPAVNAINNDCPPTIDYEPIRFVDENDTVNLNDGGQFIVGCECDGPCQRDSCLCVKEGFEQTMIRRGYVNRRMTGVGSGTMAPVFECNSKCKCDSRCPNRVAQIPIRRNVQLFRTMSKGWGLRTMDDIAKGTFICTYAGRIMTESSADNFGKNFGDEYLADLDFIELAINQFKQRKPGYDPLGHLEDKGIGRHKENTNETDVSMDSESEYSADESTVAIGGYPSRLSIDRSSVSSSDENDEVKAAQTVTGTTDAEGDSSPPENATVPNYTSSKETEITAIPHRTIEDIEEDELYKFRDRYFEEQAPHIMDAKTKGNVGRYLNHSCDPNVMVQNVFIDTLDLRFPWVAFIACKNIKAGEELCWDYNYQVDSVADKKIICSCGSADCRGRIL